MLACEDVIIEHSEACNIIITMFILVDMFIASVTPRT